MIAHMRKTDYKEQTVQEHLESVAAIAKHLGAKGGVQSLTELAGFMHDMGKHTNAFATYINNAVKHTDAPLERIDHSTAGAKYLYETYYIEKPRQQSEVLSNLVIEIVGMAILSHHSGLQNFIETDGSPGDYIRRVSKDDLPHYKEVCSTFLRVAGNKERIEQLYESSLLEMKAFLLKLRQLQKRYGEHNLSQQVMFSILMRFVFSCLIDADRTDARRFDEDDHSDLIASNQVMFEQSYKHLLAHLQRLEAEPDASKPINQRRSAMSEQCDRMAAQPSSIRQLSIPTGGGKTLASLRYALKHALVPSKEKERIIYIVPFTTILEQNADAVRDVIRNKQAVLEHHANVIDDDLVESKLDYYGQAGLKRMQLARDNWDHPIIFTTMVQFLDTFYAKGTRKARRLHNLTNAIIIFDEVQSVPIKHLPLFNSALNYLHYFGGSSILLCTATQPSLTMTPYPLLMDKEAEMVQDLQAVVKAFQRVTIESKVTARGWTASEISHFTRNELVDKQSALIILNTKRAVLNVYQELKCSSEYNVYHLSTSMCPQHRKDILKEVKEKLRIRRDKVICVSTQLIEAGVDISFECVIRSLAGLDSIAQAAGRCNRNDEYTRGYVYIIRSQDEQLSRLPEIALGQRVLEEDVLSRQELADDLLHPAAIKLYFDYYLAKAASVIRTTDTELNVPLIELIDRAQKYVGAIPKQEHRTFMRAMYKTLESHFQVIEAPTSGVLVPYNEAAKAVITDLNEDIHDYARLHVLLKQAQLFSVSVYSHTLHRLIEEDLIYPLHQKGMYALRDVAYHLEYGLSLEGEGELSISIF